MTGRFDRRTFLAALTAGAAAVACSDDDDGDDGPERQRDRDSQSAPTTAPDVPDLAGDPFTLGVASGDPLAASVILWTRLAPDPTSGGGMPDEPVPVVWEVAADEAFATVVASGIETAEPAQAHSVHVDAGGLDPDTWYWYRFRVGQWTSPVGRARTTPEEGSPVETLRLGVASCQHWETGWYNAYRDMAAAELDLVVFLGDYIYEGAANAVTPPIFVRAHDGPEVTDLDAYRNRYALYKGDPNLQAAHAACPWLVIWDDHEVDNNYAGDRSELEGVTVEDFTARRVAAYRAWWEHQPVRMPAPEGPDLEIHRSLAYGDLATLFLLDTRQYRTDQACGDETLNLEPACDEIHEPGRTLTGDEQERWLLDGLDASSATWNVIGNQVVMTALTLGDAVLNYDQWDGYPENRRRLLEHLDTEGITNAVVLTGDIHVGGVGHVELGEGDSARTVATELVTTSISSAATFPPGTEQLVTDAIPAIRYMNVAQRGWAHHVVTADRWTAEYRVVEDNSVEGSPVTVDAVFEIRPDRPGATRTS